MQNLTSMGCLKAVWWVQTAPLNCFVPSARTQNDKCATSSRPKLASKLGRLPAAQPGCWFVVGLGKMHNHRFLATALPNGFLKPWPCCRELERNFLQNAHMCKVLDTQCSSAKCSNSTTSAESRLLENMAKIGRVPAAQLGWWLYGGAQLSAQQRAATKGQICACTFSRVLASALASRTNFRGSSRAVTKNLCWQSCRTHTCAANFWHAMQQCKVFELQWQVLNPDFQTIWKIGRVPAAQPGWWLGGGSKQDTILFQFCSAESWPPLKLH